MTTSRPSKALWFATAAVVILGAGAWLAWYFLSDSASPYEEPPLTFNGSSDQLRQTVVVPTPDTPVPEGKSVVWCNSFQLAWNELQSRLAAGPVELANGQEVADRLNAATQSEKDVSPDSVYATAGFAQDKILDRVRQNMAARFPGTPMPALFLPDDGLLAFAHLSAGVTFLHPYFDIDGGLEFTDADGNKTRVPAFGIPQDQRHAGEQTFRGQVAILHHRAGTPENRTEFILDLDTNSRPNQLVLARVPWQGTLDSTYAEVKKLIDESKPSSLGAADQLAVPVMHWRIEHQFRELQGKDKQFRNPSLDRYFLAAAVQSIHFRMDRSGAQVSSTGYALGVKSAARLFHFDQPFLICLQRRDAAYPFFLMWVDNAELLAPPGN